MDIDTMVFHSWLFWIDQSYWGDYNLSGINVKVQALNKDNFPVSPGNIPPHFWFEGFQKGSRLIVGRKPEENYFPIHWGYSEAKGLIGRGTLTVIENLCFQAINIVNEVFNHIEDESDPSTLTGSSSESGPTLVKLRLSTDLERWKEGQHAVGNVLPSKGTGETKVSDEILNILGATDWPAALVTNNAMFGCGFANLVIGATDAATMFSNYIVDMAFYYEHGYNHIFPSFEPLLEKGLLDRHALLTPGGCERRFAASIGKRYIQEKIALEKRFKLKLAYQSARMSRRAVQIIAFFESSLLGMGMEAIARGCDPGAVMSDLIFSSPGTDVVDVGSDLLNSEAMNNFLNVGDITNTGVVSEDILRRIYDAYAAAAARMFTERWYEPLVRMNATLYTWHMMNDRHMFLRRAILGWPKARKAPAQPQFEADFDEVFDEDFCLTGFSRPLDPKYECNGQDTCDHVTDFFRRNSGEPLLEKLWYFLVIGPLEYVRHGKIDEEQEQVLVEGSKLTLVKLYSQGLILEMVWLLTHTNQHAWQVNYLYEAAMFGSILDGGRLIGRLDRKEEGGNQE